MNRSVLRAAFVGAAAAGVIALLVFHGPAWGGVWRSLKSMSWPWALGAVGINLLSAIARGFSWKTVLNEAVPEPHPRTIDVFSAFFVGIFANGVLPGRVGEVARVGVLTRHLPERKGLWASLLGSVLAHRLLEIFPSLALIVWVLLFAKVPAWGRGALLAVLVGGAVIFLAGVVVARRHETMSDLGVGRVRALVERVRQGLGVLRRPAPAGVAFLFQTGAWALQLAAVWTAMRAFGMHLPWIAAGTVLALMNVALLVPLWPGNVGLQQAAIALPLVGYGIAYAHGFAYGIGLQAIESSVGYVGGLVFLLREGLTLGALKARFGT